MFASKTPRDLNHDPKPYWTPGGGSSARRWPVQSDLGLRHYRPRPEFDHAQHNEPNPILLAFRSYSQKHGMDHNDQVNLARAWLQAERYYENRLVRPAPNDRHRRHARKVLTRLANFTKEN